MSPKMSTTVTYITGFPRVSGDEPRAEVNGLKLEAFSPRERG